MPGTAYTIDIHPRIPARLARLTDLAGNLWYSFDRPTRILFARLDPALWDAIGHCPKAMLKRIDEQRLITAAEDASFIQSLHRVLSAFDTYMSEPQDATSADADDGLIAYFCAEFGIHESLPIYSGGLGILAGDQCKAASDRRLPFVGVGLLYRQGYFVQTVDRSGQQHADYRDAEFDDLPIAPARTRDGTADLVVDIPLNGRIAQAKVWQAVVGRVTVYLLDTDLPSNSDHDRDIAHRLYGGDAVTRLEQEIVLGIGGVRALRMLGLKPAVWHINEGHAAFLIVERIAERVNSGQSLEASIEAVAASTVFTTHTPVPAGHDHFRDDALIPYLEPICKDARIPVESVLDLGHGPTSADFNMTALALRGSRHHNGVSRIHGRVSSRLLQGFWPDIPEHENPVGAVTNGVHLPTFLANEWIDTFDRFLGTGWQRRLADASTWDQIHAIPDHFFWSVRQYLKSQMLHAVRQRMELQYLRNQESQSHLDRVLRYADAANPNVLTIGFARRFATYKRATLLFSDPDKLRMIVGDRERPVVFVFAGKAHPADKPGQELIRTVTQMARMPEFEGRLLFVEGYDLRLARRLVTGVDVWLNNPVYPLEASGTSGMKAGINGVINLSVLDGWWGEGYLGDNGWAVQPAASSLEPEERDREEARTLYEIIQGNVVPLYYDRRSSGHSAEWIRMAKRSMATLLPRFSAARMLGEYVEGYYRPAARQGARLAADDGRAALALASWKTRVHAAWDGVQLRRIDWPRASAMFGDTVPVEVAVKLNGLDAADVIVELVLSRSVHQSHESARYPLAPAGTGPGADEQRFVLDLKPELCGRLDYRIRVYPHHSLLTHPFELGLMRWA